MVFQLKCFKLHLKVFEFWDIIKAKNGYSFWEAAPPCPTAARDSLPPNPLNYLPHLCTPFMLNIPSAGLEAENSSK